MALKSSGGLGARDRGFAGRINGVYDTSRQLQTFRAAQPLSFLGGQLKEGRLNYKPTLSNF
ncbi:hypothetical protein C4553_01255 [Candidatus Parcubacteria bacterium]|nr:MAG: hypothetical protein C4553_01255 [Candidatus Parcubacteria bacterium]